ncbi:major capsid protein [Methylomonas rapida]|uniref:Major capsid protein n=1 Tax=Methylomonas rapida TaxID=2963939 RepID=A0ABY7GGS0_9GAMM|nr:major capsid protein [Methylomonas rapida]WAR42980.1 major capsid protein [Methylomonas rapida]WAR42993.1 major capsid protein [Methylomonas rapida]
MQVPEFDSDGYSLIVRPDPVLFTPCTPTQKKRGFYQSQLGVLLMKLNKKIAAGTALVSASIGSAFAAVPADVSTALEDAKTDASTVAGLFLIAIIAIAAFKLMQRGAS